MNKLAKATLAGAIVAFFWGMISWTVLPWHTDNIKSFKNDQVVQLALLQNAVSPEPTIYAVPSMDKKDAPGPFAFIALRPKGYPFSPKFMVKGLLTQLALAFLISFMLIKAEIPKFWCKVRFITCLGLLMGIAGYIPDWNWWGFATNYSLVGIIDQVLTWFLASLAIAKATE